MTSTTTATTLTTYHRGMILPDDVDLSFRNLMVLVGAFVGLFALSLGLEALRPELSEVMMAVSVVFIFVIYMVNRFAPSTAENPLFQSYSIKLCILAVVFVVFGVVIQVSASRHNAPTGLTGDNQRRLHTSTERTVPADFNKKLCYSSLCHGHWNTLPCNSNNAQSSTAMCEMKIWDWETTRCPIKLLSSSELQTVFHNKKIAFLGDSMVRNVYHAMITLVDQSYIEVDTQSQKHLDQKSTLAASNTTLDFFWTPFVCNITIQTTRLVASGYDVVVLGAAAWDALHNRDLTAYTDRLGELSQIVQRLAGTSYVIWMQPTTIADSQLRDPDKQKYMSEAVIATYREGYVSSSLSRHVSFTVDPTAVTLGQASSSTDGVHYIPRVSQVISQMISNGYLMEFPEFLLAEAAGAKDTSPLRTGSMGNPFYGMIVLVFSCIMIFLMDSFFGIGVLSLFVFGRSLDWEEAYLPLLKKLGIVVAAPSIQEVEEQPGDSDDGADGPNTPLLVRK